MTATTSRKVTRVGSDDIRRIKPGLFFDPPSALPRGPHTVPREKILHAQRERMMIAMTELIAAKGYPNVPVGEITERAAVSRAVFYECFADKEACAAAAYDRFIEVLLTGMATTLRPGQPIAEFAVGAVQAYLAPIEDDPVVGRAFQVEIDAMGPVARTRRRESLQQFGDTLAAHHRTLVGDESAELLPASAYLGVVYAVRQLACDALETDDSPHLLEMIPDLTVWLLKLLGR